MTDRLDEIRARLDGATPGPWVRTEMYYDGPLQAVRVVGREDEAELPIADFSMTRDEGADNGLADAEFIAAAPGDISFLLGEVERLTAELAAPVKDRQVAEMIANPAEYFSKVRAGMRAEPVAAAESRDAELLVLREQARSEAVRGNEAQAEAAELRAEIDRLTAERAAVAAEIRALITPLSSRPVEAPSWRTIARNTAYETAARIVEQHTSFIPQTGDQA